MKRENLEKVNQLNSKIETIEKSIKVLSWGLSDSFKERDSQINILGTSQDDGFAVIPECVLKTICKISLMACKENLIELEKELESL